MCIHADFAAFIMHNAYKCIYCLPLVNISLPQFNYSSSFILSLTFYYVLLSLVYRWFSLFSGVFRNVCEMVWVGIAWKLAFKAEICGVREFFL